MGPEMVGPRHILMIWTGADSDQDIEVVEEAFKELARRYPPGLKDSEVDLSLLLGKALRPQRIMSLREAFFAKAEAVDVAQALGRISADTVVIYSPGGAIDNSR